MRPMRLTIKRMGRVGTRQTRGLAWISVSRRRGRVRAGEEIWRISCWLVEPSNAVASWSESLVVECRSALEQVRSSAPDYVGIRVQPVVGPSGHTTDGNMPIRVKCLWAAQYEPRPFV